jgi:ABC-2 type transport system permease protein
MTAAFALIRKQFIDSRWILLFSALALFGLSWLFVFMTARIERQLADAAGAMEGGPPPRGMLARFGGPEMDFSSAAIEVMFWNHPFILFTIALWAISRGSAGVAAEIERGTIDLILSRPVSRFAYLAANIVMTITGLIVLSLALVVGNRIANQYNVIAAPPSTLLLLKPAMNLAALGLAIYGYTLLASAMDSVRWRPMLIGSLLTLAGFIIHVAVNLPTMEEWQRLDRYSIFKAFNPVELVTKGETLEFNLGILSLVGVIGVAAAFVGFLYRDVPANS